MRHSLRYLGALRVCEASSQKNVFCAWPRSSCNRTISSIELRRMPETRRDIYARVSVYSLLHVYHAIFIMKCVSQTACECVRERHVLFPFPIRVNFSLWLANMRYMWLPSMAGYLFRRSVCLSPSLICHTFHYTSHVSRRPQAPKVLEKRPSDRLTHTQ